MYSHTSLNGADRKLGGLNQQGQLPNLDTELANPPSAANREVLDLLALRGPPLSSARTKDVKAPCESAPEDQSRKRALDKYEKTGACKTKLN